MSQCCYKTHSEDAKPFQKSMPYQHSNCCVAARKEYPTNIPMQQGKMATRKKYLLPGHIKFNLSAE